jgi:hypothetical protein
MTTLGLHHTVETRQKMSKAHQGKKKPWAGKYKHSLLASDHKNNIRKSLIGHDTSYETREKIAKALSGRKRPPETLEKMRATMLGMFAGDKHWNWQGGISSRPYFVDWTKTLRRSIRERDNYTCVLCGSTQTERTYPIHHIDYQKTNCDPDNLVTLCPSCHSKTNSHKDSWLDVFNKLKENEK